MSEVINLKVCLHLWFSQWRNTIPPVMIIKSTFLGIALALTLNQWLFDGSGDH